MSNPAVINLAEINTDIGLFRVEDNIGEAIHIHLGEFRIDLTIEEFHELTNSLDIAVENLLCIKDFKVSNYSYEFLSRIAYTLPDLLEVKIEEIALDDIIIDCKGFFGTQTKKKLRYSRVYRALNGDTTENDARNERNYFNQTNQQRVNAIFDSVKSNGYPIKNKFIVMFNKSNDIQDGQHRAASLYYINGNIKIPILRMFFKDNKYNVTNHPYLFRLYYWDIPRVKRGIKKAYHLYKAIKYYLETKYISLLIRIDKFKYGLHRIRKKF